MVLLLGFIWVTTEEARSIGHLEYCMAFPTMDLRFQNNSIRTWASTIIELEVANCHRPVEDGRMGMMNSW